LIVCESTIDFIFVLLFVGKMNKLDDGKDTFVQKSLKEAQWPEGDSNLEAHVSPSYFYDSPCK
jgi:hypothetical protein